MSDYICPYTCSYRTNSGFCGHTGGWERCQYRQLRQPNTVVGYVPPLKKTCAGPCALKGSNIDGDCEGYTPMSHYEQIKAMSVEEMTRWLAKFCDCLHCPGFYGPCYARCEEYWLDWLRSEEKEDE